MQLNSVAHGANDIANSIGCLAVVWMVYSTGTSVSCMRVVVANAWQFVECECKNSGDNDSEACVHDLCDGKILRH